MVDRASHDSCANPDISVTALPSDSLASLLIRCESAFRKWLVSFNEQRTLIAEQTAILDAANMQLKEIRALREWTLCIVGSHRRLR